MVPGLAVVESPNIRDSGSLGASGLGKGLTTAILHRR